MSIRTQLRTPVTLLHPGWTTDRTNNDVADWTDPDEEETRGDLQQTDSTEVTVGRDTVVTNLRLFLRPEATPTERDRAVVNGVTYEVVGRPYKPRGHHWELWVRESAEEGMDDS